MRPLRVACLLLFVINVAQSFAQSTSFSDELNQGIVAYKHARYEDATQHFKNAVALDPQQMRAHLYLATTYAQQYIPGANTTDNNEVWKSAVDEYLKVIDLDPNNLDSIKGIAYLYLQAKHFDSAKEYYRKAIASNPDDPEPFYSIAVIDWTESYQPRMELRHKVGLDDAVPLIHKNECWVLRDASQDRIKDGMEMIERALALRPDHDDAMAYMNLLYRERADIQCGDQAAKEADIREADMWVDRTIATKKRSAEKAERHTKAPAPK